MNARMYAAALALALSSPLIAKTDLAQYIYHKGETPPASSIAFREQQAEEILAYMKHDRIKFLNLEFTDVFGNPKSYTITRKVAKDALIKGVNFDGSSIAGYANITRSDLLLVPDLETFVRIPWPKDKLRTACIVCDVHHDFNTPVASCPRVILKKVEAEARAMGYQFNVSPELEFFLIKRNPENKSSSLDNLGYCEHALLDETDDMKKMLLHILKKIGARPEKIHHEVASSQHEITTRYGRALILADRLVTAKLITTFVADKYGYDAIFMPKPIEGQNGSGMHIHFSLADATRGENVFYDRNDPQNLSSLAKQFIAGALHYVDEFTALYNPVANSYKRLVAGYEAPTYICWGDKNRSSLIRVPAIAKNDHAAARAEIRSPDPMANPYLAFAALLKSGLEGIKKGMTCPEMVSENLFTLSPEEVAARGIRALSGSLSEATDRLAQSALAKELLGEHLHAFFVTTKRKEAAAASFDTISPA